MKVSEPNYEARVRSQIEQYAETVNMHDLPPAFHLWSHDHIAPGIEYVFGTSSIDEAFAMAYMEATRDGGKGRILSVGCGDGAVEIRIAKILLGREVRDFMFVCADLFPLLLGRLRASVQSEGLGAYFESVEADLNRTELPGMFDVVMANHSLHHMENLEVLFAYIRDRLKERGIFAACDMIGRNGHMRWAEPAAFVHAIWPMLEKRQRYHAQLKRYYEQFVDHDCSTEGFEGIRAQDILPLVLKEFFPYKFFGAGGIVDLFVDRGFGHGVDTANDRDVEIVKLIARLNDILLDARVISPTWMLAYFTKDDRGERFYRDRRAIESVRNRDADPGWTRFYRVPEVAR